ncbi:polysaccharide biosynthesis tyrosine autokinase [Kineosporia rhizophila]|uniref:polysaccharide biosynthesis tyrosine autokinase n=1 Tax=Kineosporia rhizophila TaxID=84633 RepID=UPI001E3020C1|nr:polysaccharide biosynthesis tyrosine autokinase [Kineosporia rhizophila]MCE0539056.1 polysaccharide biosynthesis tyrosine autokinase [Kineosporia rhizophila]
MTLTQYLKVLRQHWLIVLALAVLGVAAATAYTSRQTPMYQAQTQVFVSVQGPGGGDTLNELSESSTFSQQRVKSYASMATSSAVTEPVVRDLRLPYTAAVLAGQIEASPQLDTVLIDLTVTDADPARAAAIAGSATQHLQKVVGDLESNGGSRPSSVKLTVTRPPVEPQTPVSPRVPLNIALGLLLGLGLGVGAAVLRDQLNTTLRGSSDVEQLTGSVPLGVVPFDASAPKQPLVTADAFGGRAEAFRTLRTNLQFADVDRPPRVIAVTSALPDEGKTTTACNIALTLAQSGARVILIEGDLRKPAVGKYLGISNAAGLTNVLAGQHDLREVVVGYERDLLAVLPSGPTPPNPSELLGSQQMRHLLDTLAQHYDVVVIDAPPLLPVTDAALIATAADGAILVIRHGRSRREEAERALKALEAVSARMLGTVLNFAPRKKGRNGYQGYGYGSAPAASAPGQQPETTSRRARRGGKDEVAAAPERIVLPDAGATSLPLEPVSPESPDEPGGSGSGPENQRTPGGTGVPAGRPGGPNGFVNTSEQWAPDMGWAPSPSDGWAPIADSPSAGSRAPQASSTGGISVFGGLSSTGPLPVVTTPGTDGLAVVSRAEGLEVLRTAEPEGPAPQVIPQRKPDRLEVHHDTAVRSAREVPEELRLQPLPPETGYRAPDTAPKGIPLPVENPAAWSQTSWFAPEPAPEPTLEPAPEPAPAAQDDSREGFEEIPPLLVDLHTPPELDLLEDERELLIPPQSVMPHVPTGVPRHHRSKRSI